MPLTVVKGLTTELCRVLVIGATGNLRRHIVRACVEAGHRTYALVRHHPSFSDPQRCLLLQSFKDSNVRIIEGCIEDRAILVLALRRVDAVISVLGTGSLLKQLQLIKAIKKAGNIKRFVPSEFGVDVDRITRVPALQKMFEGKLQTRRAIEAVHIPYTYISASCHTSSFLGCLLQPGLASPPSDGVMIYGAGDVKGVYVDELDVAAFTTKAINDPRTLNKTLYIRPPLNVLTQNEMVLMWEGKSQKSIQRMRLLESKMEIRIQGIFF
ncbi:hypothetical protein L7F22_049344 [Adiantum nelumboides]|nr:hypothetical protein [Adiantum nelumboides]